MKLSLAVTGKLHAAAGASGPPGGSDEERPEEESHRVPLGGTEARGLHPAGQRQVGVHLRETSAVPVQSEWLLKLQLPDSWLHFKVTSLHLYTFPNGRTLHEVNRLKRVRIPAKGFGSGCLEVTVETCRQNCVLHLKVQSRISSSALFWSLDNNSLILESSDPRFSLYFLL